MVGEEKSQFQRESFKLLVSFFSLCGFLLFFSGTVIAVQDDYVAFECNDSLYRSATTDAVYDLYFPVDEFRDISVPVDNVTIDGVVLDISGVYYNFSDGGSYYNISLMDTVEGVGYYRIIEHYNTSDICYVQNVTIRYAVPFNVTIRLWFWTNNNTLEAERLYNEFSYVGLVPRNRLDYERWSSFGAINVFDKKLKFDDNEAYWGEYVEGEAIITLYRPENYTLFTLNTKQKTSYSGNAFYFPHIDDLDESFLTVIDIKNTSSVEYDVMLNRFEKYWSFGLNNFVWMIVGFVVWILLVYMVSYLFQNAKFTIGIAIGTLPFVMYFLGVVW